MFDDAKRLLEMLFGHSKDFLLLRFIKGDRVITRFTSLQDIDWEEVVRLNRDEQYDVFFGVCPRNEGMATKEGVTEATCLWADLDGEDFAGGKAEAWRQIWSLPGELEPSAEVDSGHGYHLYWLLYQPAQIMGEEDIARVEGYVAGLGKLLGGDTVQDLSRLMRLPETHNWKDPEHPVKCNVVSFNPGRRFDLSAFEQYWVATGHGLGESIAFSSELPEVDIEDMDISARMKDLAIHGFYRDCGYKSRSEADQAVITALLGAGCSNDEIKAIFLKYAIGQRYKERGDQYLARSIANARAWMAQQRLEEPRVKINDKQPATTKPEEVASDESQAVRADWREIKKHLPEEGEAVIEGLLSGGSQAKMLISGVSGFGKTTLGLNMAIPIARAGLVFGKLRVPQRRRVALVDLERVAVAVADQTELLTRTLGEPEPGDLDIITGEFKILDKRSMDMLREKLSEGPPGVAIFDSIVNLVSDYNDTTECNMVKDFFQEVLVDLKWAVILLHHVATGVDSGVGHGRALGTLGKTLDRWAGTKLAYEGIDGLECYGRLHGVSRSAKWSNIDLLLGYEKDTQVLTIVDWDEIPLPQGKKRLVIGPSPRTLEFRQFRILATRLGHTAEDIADMIGVSKTTMYRYNSGEDVPSEETWQLIQEVWDRLRGDAGVDVG